MSRTWVIYKSILFLLFFIPSQKADQGMDKLFDHLGLYVGALELDVSNVPIIQSKKYPHVGTRAWTLMLYISADNDLAPFAIRNIKQMAWVGSNDFFNIVVQLDIRKEDGQKVTRRYYVAQDKVLHLNADDPDSQAMDSGNPETLISFCRWATTFFPAKQHALIFWNHGTGILDPARYRTVKSHELFAFNPQTELLELDRSVGFLDRMLYRGICFDDSAGNYLTNQDLEYALDAICTHCLGGQKFAFIGFDACLMQMIEVANLMKRYAHIMVGSQEAGLGYGWNYAMMLEPFNNGPVEVRAFMEHLVQCYKKSYENIIQDYAFSAIDLDLIDDLEKNVNDIAVLLLRGLNLQKDRSLKKIVTLCASKRACTHFDEPSYIDLHNFYCNLLGTIDQIFLHNPGEQERFRDELEELLIVGADLIERIVFANAVGDRLKKARGISIYFPKRRIHSSYHKTLFAKENRWRHFLRQCLAP